MLFSVRDLYGHGPAGTREEMQYTPPPVEPVTKSDERSIAIGLLVMVVLMVLIGWGR